MYSALIFPLLEQICQYKEQAVYMLLQEEQLSDFLPAYIEFSRFSDGSKLNCSPRCRQSVSIDGTNISNFFESCIIVSRFFYSTAKKAQSTETGLFLFVPF